MIDSAHSDDRDAGAILLLVLAVAIVLSLVVLALANFVAADLRYTRVIDSRAKTLSSAESGIDYAVDRLRLNQTLCATDAASSAVNLNGAPSPGTPLPQPLNGTDTRITCERLDGAIADVAGWSVVISDSPSAPRLHVQMDGVVVPLPGPVFLPDPDEVFTDADSRVEVVDGDVWYTDTSGCGAPKAPNDLPNGLLVGPSVARGPECTTRDFGALFSAPPVSPTLPTDLDPAPNDVLFPGCLVFYPGHYTVVPDFGGQRNVYFWSGDYHLDFPDRWFVNNDATVWIGSDGSLVDSAQVANVPCEAARDADELDESDGIGATLYFDGDSRIRVDDRGSIEMFARQQGNYSVSVQALAGSTTGDFRRLIASEHFAGRIDLVIHGLVWAPDGWFQFDNDDNTGGGSQQKLLGGIVVARFETLFIHPPDFEIRPATSSVDTRILLTSKSTIGTVSTTVEAVVEYRPQAPTLDERVAVSSFRVVD